MLADHFLSNKFVLNRLFFNYEYNIRFNQTQIDEFWMFLDKFCQKSQQISNDRKSAQLKYDKLIENLRGKFPEQWTDLDGLKRQLSNLNPKKSLSKSDLFEFRNIVLMYVDFNQRRKEKRLEKLAQFQRNLPIHEYKTTILEALRTNSVLLIAGDTGCGKSTQVPQYLLRNGYEKICCTQPRRIACIALCHRLSHETADDYGSEIGYQIRFEKSKTKSTKILFLTEGLLLRQLSADPILSNYQVLILDEIHERHLSSDFLLGAIKCLLHKRKNDLKVILMSATVNCELFSNYFGDCQVIKVPGRLYPIKTEYFPINKINIFKSSSAKINPDPYLKILQRIDEQYPSDERGDVLVFLSGFAEIEAVGEKLKIYADQTRRWIILYLHSALPLVEQDKVFDLAPEGVRKCILSTNIAETSITIDGIRFVIDSGKVKEMFYESKIRMHRLQEIWISKASAEQRKGRAGRTGPGLCFRLYSQNDFDSFDDFSKPEIQRVSLESLILNMIAMGLNDIRKFPFIEPPTSMDIENTLKCLISYCTLDEQEKITHLGHILAKLPVDIPIGKMLIFSICINLYEYALSLAACLSVQSMTTIRSKNNFEMIEERKSLISFDGDLFSSMNFYRKWLTLKGQNQDTRSWCRRMGFEEQRFHEITKLRRQFEDILKDGGLIDSAGSYNNDKNRPLTKSERIAKHGERKLYKRLKEQVGSSRNKRKKFLKIDEDQNNNDQDDDDDDNDGKRKPEKDLEWNLKELEFNLFFDSNYFKENERKNSLKEGELDLIKLILIKSFYPQFAIADLDNSYHLGSDILFHTKEKPFVVLHPSSVYFNQPDLLNTSSTSEIESLPIGNVSYKHYLLGYISFIETNKSYICNCYQISSIHMLLLTSMEIDTNEDCSRLVFDNWIEIKFKYQSDGEEILINSLKIRKMFSNFLQFIFENLKENDHLDFYDETFLELKQKLIKEIRIFLKSKVKYAIKRLLSADLKTIYRKDNEPIKVDELKKFKKHSLVNYILENINHNNNNGNEDDKSNISISNKGGFHYEFINFNCLKNDQSDEKPKDNRKEFRCHKCDTIMFVSPLEQARHLESCHGTKTTTKTKINDPNTAAIDTTTTNLKDYFCKICQKEFSSMTNIEILRHRKKHQDQKEEEKIEQEQPEKIEVKH